MLAMYITLPSGAVGGTTVTTQLLMVAVWKLTDPNPSPCLSCSVGMESTG
jgi:hypothetical protein